MIHLTAKAFELVTRKCYARKTTAQLSTVMYAVLGMNWKRFGINVASRCNV